ncbi:hypothetical protein GCM10023084_38370 [Streptomyces lacrimifluminis]|uniref:Uncharacterized protein n=1 Tax=Streptomyces lacrimifluminis TaxID=1500077 RepID=A0A917NXP7_9ACTN|nr:hypothetical protein GCM10012282_39990 [Streptomyces lacrimifluminis]
MNPAPTLAPVPNEPLQLSLAAVTMVWDRDHSAFQPRVSFRPVPKPKVGLQLPSAAGLSVILAEPCKRTSHVLVTEHPTVHAGAASDAVTTGATAVPTRDHGSAEHD